MKNIKTYMIHTLFVVNNFVQDNREWIRIILYYYLPLL